MKRLRFFRIDFGNATDHLRDVIWQFQKTYACNCIMADIFTPEF